MVATKFQVGDKVKCSLRCPKDFVFKGIDKILNREYKEEDKCSWYELKKQGAIYRSYELEKV